MIFVILRFPKIDTHDDGRKKDGDSKEPIHRRLGDMVASSRGSHHCFVMECRESTTAARQWKSLFSWWIFVLGFFHSTFRFITRRCFGRV
jgi:hypothetical protein